MIVISICDFNTKGALINFLANQLKTGSQVFLAMNFMCAKFNNNHTNLHILAKKNLNAGVRSALMQQDIAVTQHATAAKM